MSVVTAAAVYEKMGIPTVAIHYDEIMSVALDAAATQGNAMPALRHLTFNAQVGISTVVAALVDTIIDGLTRPLTASEAFAGTWVFEPEERYLAVGSYEEVRFAMNGDMARCTATLASSEFTDGSPVALPTEAALKEMLKGTFLPPDTPVGMIEPLNSMATVENVAIQGIMAGLTKETLPLLLALTEAMSKTHDFGSSLGGADGFFAFGTFISGPAISEMKINTGGPGNAGPAPLTPAVPTNTGIGRFVRLVQVNIGGTEAGIFEAKGLGNPAKTSIVVAEEAPSAWGGFSSVIPKDPMNGDRTTFSANESTVSMFVLWGDMLAATTNTYSGTATSVNPEGSGYTDAQWSALRGQLASILEGAKSLNRPQQGLVLMISPSRARTLANAGVTRSMAMQWASEYCNDKNSVARSKGLGSGVVGAGFTVQGENLHADRNSAFWLPPASQPDEIVRYFPDSRLVNIIVGPGLTYNGLVMNGLPRWTVEIDKWRGEEVIVDPEVPADSIRIDGAALATMRRNTTRQLTVTMTPVDTTSAVIWSSSNSNMATVDEDGLVTAKAPGTVIITAKTADSLLTSTITIRVTA